MGDSSDSDSDDSKSTGKAKVTVKVHAKTDAGDKVKKVADDVADGVKKAADSVKESAKKAGNAIAETWDSLMKKLKQKDYEMKLNKNADCSKAISSWAFGIVKSKDMAMDYPLTQFDNLQNIVVGLGSPKLLTGWKKFYVLAAFPKSKNSNGKPDPVRTTASKTSSSTKAAPAKAKVNVKVTAKKSSRRLQAAQSGDLEVSNDGVALDTAYATTGLEEMTPTPEDGQSSVAGASRILTFALSVIMACAFFM